MPLVFALVFLSACSSPMAVVDTDTSTPIASAPVGAGPLTESTTPSPEPDATGGAGNGLPVEIFAPAEVGAHPVLVTVHGGGWVTGSPAAMSPLADALSTEGVVVFNVTYRTMSEGGRFPGMVEDVACGIAYARSHAAEYTTTPERVYVAGHSAGAHLAALVALAPGSFQCPDGGKAEPDGFVGLAGPYDVERIPILATLFGATIQEDPQTWAEGNPLTHAGTAPKIPILLIHGDEDTTVPSDFSTGLGDALGGAGLDVTVEILPGRTHPDVIDPAIVGDLIAAFIE